MRAVVDANTWVAALMRHGGAPTQVLDAFMEGRFALVSSEPILAELLTIHRRPRLARLCAVGPEDVAAMVAYLRERAVMVSATGEHALCRDQDDNKLIEAAIRGHAPAIVTRDGDLHDEKLAAKLRPFGIRVLYPHELLQLVRMPA